jgi:uncharacterized membrane protein YhaH (DUF805 family)
MVSGQFRLKEASVYGYNTYSSANTAALGCAGIAGVIFVLAICVFSIYCYWRICAKAGYSGAMALLCLVPGVGAIILMCILAFGNWPIHAGRNDVDGRGPNQ